MNALWTRPAQAPPVVKWTVLAALALLLAAFFPWLTTIWGTAARIIALVVVFPAALFWGVRGALPCAIGAQISIFAYHQFAGIDFTGGLLGPTYDISASVLIGYFRDLGIRLTKEVEKVQKGKKLLSEYRDRLEEKVIERTTELEEVNQNLYQEALERERASRELRASEKRFRELFNNISDFVYSHSLDGRLLSINPIAAEGLGYTQEELLEHTLQDLMPPRLRGSFFTKYMETLQKHGVEEGVMTLLNSQGEEYAIKFRSLLHQNQNGKAFVTGSGRNETQTRKARQEIDKLRQQLVQSQKMEAIGALASGVAHDFNHLLHIFSKHLQRMDSSEKDTGEKSRYLAELRPAVNKASELVKSLLAISHASQPELQDLDLNSQILHWAANCRHSLPKTITLETKLSDGLWAGSVDSIQLDQVLTSLAANASEASKGYCHLLIETKNVTVDQKVWPAHLGLDQGNYILISFSDDGPGMDKKTRTRIFEPFFTTKGDDRGSGLGLSTVYGIIKAHKGNIDCYSEEGMGTNFKIYLPASLSRSQMAQQEKSQDLQGAVTGEETVLLVDDESCILEIGSEMLRRKGYKVITASSGEEALKQYQNGGSAIDLVILDLSMPGMGGRACLTELKDLDQNSKVIVSSGYSARGRAKETIEVGADDFLQKPYRFSEMAAMVRSVLDD